jgi:hypothetical protein
MSEHILTHKYQTHKHQTHNHAASGWRIHCDVEVTESSTNKQHTFSLKQYVWFYVVKLSETQSLSNPAAHSLSIVCSSTCPQARQSTNAIQVMKRTSQTWSACGVVSYAVGSCSDANAGSIHKFPVSHGRGRRASEHR